MLIIILLIICLIVSAIYTKTGAGSGCTKMYYVKYYLVTFFALCVAGIIIYALVLAIASCCGTVDNQYIEEDYKIYGLQFDKQLESYSKGTFILGCGGFSSGSKTTNTYYFFSDSEYGKKLETLNNNGLDVYIKETDNEEPNLKTIYNHNKLNDFWQWFLWIRVDVKTEKGKILTVPTDTIKIDYNVEVK